MKQKKKLEKIGNLVTIKKSQFVSKTPLAIKKKGIPSRLEVETYFLDIITKDGQLVDILN